MSILSIFGGSKPIEQKVWDKAIPIKGRDPSAVRSDPYGDEIHRHDYGKDTRYGWEVDHIRPVSCGGSDHISNLQALRTKANRGRDNVLVKKSRHYQ